MSFIDERVVKMVFDSAKFEQGIQKTLGLLDNLKNALMLKGASTGLDNLQKSVGGFDMSSLSSAVETVSNRFSTLGIIGTTALVKITNQAIDAGERLLKSLSVDQVAAGWQKFGEKTSAVGTLVSQGNELEFVNDQMDRLNWFTDETSYNFTDMANNIAKFTATGKGLEESVTMMQGIALWAAASGQNASTASRAMYQLSQAMGSGVMRKEDWKSIQNTSMDTDEFRQIALDTAVALGKLKKTGEDTYQSLQSKSKAGAAEFKKAQFADSLTEGAWFDADVMEAVYKKYGSASEVIREFVETNDQGIETASEAIKAIEERDKAIVESYSKENNLSIEDATKALVEEGKILDPLAIKWFKAGQEARTFADVIDSVKDAVSTQFMNIFQKIFGNYEEAKTLWTDLANALWDMFAGPLQQVNDLLDIWKKLGGRTIFLDSLKNGWEAILALTDPIKKAFENIFPNDMKAGKLYQLTKEFYKFTASLKIGRDFADKIQRTFQGVFSVFDLVGQAISAVGRTIADFGGPIITLARNFLGLTGSVGDFVTDMAAAAKENDFFYNSIQKLIEFISPAFETVKNIIDGAIQAFENFTGIDLHIPTFKEFTDTLNGIKITLDPVISVLKAGAEGIHNFFESLNASQMQGGEKQIGIFAKIGEIFGKLAKIFGPVLTAIKNSFSKFLDYFSQALDNVDGNKVTALLGGGLFAIVGLKIKDFIDGIKDKLKPLDDIKHQLSELKDSLIDTFGSIQKSLQAGTLLKIAAAIGILAASLIALSGTENIGTGLAALGGIMMELAAFVAVLKIIDELGGDKGEGNISKVTTGLIKMAVAVSILSKAVSALSKLEPEELAVGLTAVGFVLLELGVFAGAMEKYAGGVENASKGMIQLAASILILTLSMKLLGKMEWEEIGKGLVGVGVLLGELGLFSKLAGGAKHIVGTGVAMLAIAASLTVLTAVLFAMGKTADTMGTGLLIMAGLLFELGVAMYFMESALPGAAALLIVAGAIAILTPALILLGAAMTGDGIARALITLAGAFLVIGAASAILGLISPVVLAGAAALAAFGAALLITGAGMAAFGAGLTLFVAGVVGAGATLIAGFGLIQKSISFMVTMIIEAIKQMISEATGLIPFVVELGLMLVDGVLQGIARHLPSIIQSGATIIIAFLTGVTQYLPAILEAGINLMIVFINGMANGIRDHTEDILGALGNLVSAMIELVITGVQGLLRQIPGVGEDLANKLEGLKNGVKDTLAPEDFEDIAKGAAESMTHEFESASGEVYTIGGKTGRQFGEGLVESKDNVDQSTKTLTDTMTEGLGSPDLLSTLGTTGETDIQAWIDGAGLKTGDIETMMKSLSGTATTNLGNDDGKYTDAGSNATLGFIQGMGSHDSEVSSEAQRIANLALTSMTSKQGLDEHSPSKKTYKIGINAGRGFIDGLESTEGDVKDASVGLANASTEGLKNGIDSQIGILDYADNAVGIFANHWGLLQDNMSNTEAFQAGKDAIELLALQLYAASEATNDSVDNVKDNAKNMQDILSGVKKAYADMRSSLIQTIDSQTDMFKMFDFGEAIRPEEMIANMESNIRAIDTYYQNIEALTEKGLSEGILNHLKELGPKGAGEMRSFLNMTAEQLDRANELWAAKEEKMGVAADHVIASMAYAGVQTAGGFVDGMNPETGEMAAQTFIEAALQKMRDTVGVNLQNFEAVGGEVAESVASGLEKSSDESTKKSSTKAAENVSDSVSTAVGSKVNKESGKQIGVNLCEGIAEGIRSGIEVATTAAEELALKLVETVKNALGIASPSKVFADLGYYSDLGLSGGLTKYGTVVREAAADTALGAVDEMSGVFGRIADIIDGTIDLDPTIRPVLDLTNLQYGATQIGSLLGLNDPYALNAVAGITGIQNDASLMASLTGSLTDAINGMKKDQEATQVTINIYPQEGQSAEEIAEEVSWRLNHDVLKRRAVYGGT